MSHKRLYTEDRGIQVPMTLEHGPVTSSGKSVPGPDPRIRHRIQMDMFRPIRVDHTNCLQVVIKTHSFTKTQHVTKSRGRHCGDIELVSYLANVGGPVSLVLDLLIIHDRSEVPLTLVLTDTYITLKISINHSMRLFLTRSESIDLTTMITP